MTKQDLDNLYIAAQVEVSKNLVLESEEKAKKAKTERLIAEESLKLAKLLSENERKKLGLTSVDLLS